MLSNFFLCSCLKIFNHKVVNDNTNFTVTPSFWPDSPFKEIVSLVENFYF
jgi:hypothetical protein